MTEAPGAQPRRWPRWLETVLALALGAVLAQCFGDDRRGGASVLLLALFLALLWRDPRAAPRERWRRGAGLGWALGLGWFGAGLWWIDVSLHVYGGMAQWIAVPALLLLAGFLALFPATAAAAAAALTPPHRRTPWHWRDGLLAATGFAGAWTLTELVRATLLTGFPWLALGYAQVDNPLAGFAPLLGVHGVGLVAAFAAALLALLSQLGVGGAAASCAALVLLALGGQQLTQTAWTAPSGPPLRVTLLQGDVAQSEKFQPQQLAPTLALYGDWLRQSNADLVITPETALPVLPQDLPPGWLEQLDATLHQHGVQALVGIPLTRGEDQYTNSAIGLGGDAGYRYDKVHLVPFGEFIPWGLHWFVALMQMPLGDFARGAPQQASLAVHGVRIAPTICYEDLFGDELARRFIDPRQAPNLIANLTNLAWFGDTSALGQHLQIARMRSLEFQLPSLRATNTGTTAAIGADGRVLGRLQAYARGVLHARLQGRAGLTPYAWLAARYDDGPLALLALGLLAAAVAMRRRRSL